MSNMSISGFRYYYWLITFIVLAVSLFTQVNGQFWKLNNLSDKDQFILETKSSMASGICYKQINRDSNDPELRLKTISYCCDGYEQNQKSNAIKCDPICTEDCTNGICTAPDVCECYPGYWRTGGQCEEM